MVCIPCVITTDNVIHRHRFSCIWSCAIGITISFYKVRPTFKTFIHTHLQVLHLEQFPVLLRTLATPAVTSTVKVHRSIGVKGEPDRYTQLILSKLHPPEHRHTLSNTRLYLRTSLTNDAASRVFNLWQF